jgi:hypothetical protein
LLITRFPGDHGAYRRALLQVKFGTGRRASGMSNLNLNFGYRGRVPLMQKTSCAPCTFAVEYSEAHEVIAGSSRAIYDRFHELLPEVAKFTADAASVILEEWRMSGSPWSSGVINKNSALFYHMDRNNIRDTWSAMVVTRRDCTGGHLHLPEYDVTIKCRDGDVVLFPGSSLLHGVTPMHARGDGYRITTVYYTVSKMKHCLPFEEEMRRAAEKNTASALALVERQKKAGLL